MYFIGGGIILLLLIAILIRIQLRKDRPKSGIRGLLKKMSGEGFQSAPFTMQDDKMLLSVRPDLCSMYTNATDCIGANSSSKNERLKGGCSWNAATGMCQPGSGTEAFTSPKCAMYRNCADCNKEDTCGWCGGAEMCMDKSELATLCTGTGKTPVADVAGCCTRRTDCTKCTGEEDCGWCKKTGTCLLADRLGTSAGKCNPETDFATFPSNCATPSVNFGSGTTFTPPWETGTGTTAPPMGTAAPAPSTITLDQYNSIKNKLIQDIIAELKGMKA